MNDWNFSPPPYPTPLHLIVLISCLNTGYDVILANLFNYIISPMTFTATLLCLVCSMFEALMINKEKIHIDLDLIPGLLFYFSFNLFCYYANPAFKLE